MILATPRTSILCRCTSRKVIGLFAVFHVCGEIISSCSFCLPSDIPAQSGQQYVPVAPLLDEIDADKLRIAAQKGVSSILQIL